MTKETVLLKEAIRIKTEDQSDMRSFWVVYVDRAMKTLGISKDEVDYDYIVGIDK